MKYIANIVSKSKKYKFNEFINAVNTYDDIDVSVPTLIVGTEMAKSINGDKLDYINKKIDNNIFWTFSTVEKRSENEKDVKKFQELIIKELKKTIKYTFFSVLTNEKYKMKRLIRLLLTRTDIFYFFTEKMLYISYDNNVVGISLDECKYIGVSIDKIIKKINKRTNNITSFRNFTQKIDGKFFNNDEILLSAMFCYLNR